MSNSNHDIIDKDMDAQQDMGVIGAYSVQITAEEGSGCGQICVQAYEVKQNVDWTCMASTESSSNTHTQEDGTTECTGTTIVSNPPCQEVHYSITPEAKPEPENEKTGAFASYTILAAGALIAISAITIAKKHNRISKI